MLLYDRCQYNISGLLAVISYLPGPTTVSYTTYAPSLVEWGAGLGIIAYGLMAFSLGVKYLRVVDHRMVSEEHVTVKAPATDRVPA